MKKSKVVINKSFYLGDLKKDILFLNSMTLLYKGRGKKNERKVGHFKQKGLVAALFSRRLYNARQKRKNNLYRQGEKA